MNDAAAHLVDRVLPDAAYRQWVLSYPRQLRLLLACNASAATESTSIFTARDIPLAAQPVRRKGLKKPHVGAVSFTQRFGARLKLNLHHHAVLPDGLLSVNYSYPSTTTISPHPAELLTAFTSAS